MPSWSSAIRMNWSVFSRGGGLVVLPEATTGVTIPPTLLATADDLIE